VPTVDGFWPTVLFGVLGGVLAEVIRVAEGLKLNKAPTTKELLGSLLYIACGAFVFLFGWQTPQKMIAVAAMGAAFPFTFAGIARVKGASEAKAASAQAERPLGGLPQTRNRTWTDYMTSRF
jgi:hypothetical protein